MLCFECILYKKVKVHWSSELEKTTRVTHLVYSVVDKNSIEENLLGIRL